MLATLRKERKCPIISNLSLETHAIRNKEKGAKQKRFFISMDGNERIYGQWLYLSASAKRRPARNHLRHCDEKKAGFLNKTDICFNKIALQNVKVMSSS